MRARNSHTGMSGFLVVCLLAACGLKPVNSEAACRRGCPQSDYGLLQYAAGQVYEYGFDSVMTVGLSSRVGSDRSADTDDTNLVVEGTAKVFSEGNCGYTLQLSSVKVTATQKSVEKKITETIQKPVHFTMVGGKVQPQICTDNDESTFALNVKRAVISLFQSNTEADNEVDVFGQCPTHTSVSKLGGDEIVTKVRNLNACAYREQFRSGILSGVINERAGVKSTMLLQADYSKEAKVQGAVIAEVHLVEQYKFTGTDSGSPGVRAKVVTTMKLKNPAGSPAAAPATGDRAASIIFQKPETHAAKNIAALKSTFGQAVQLVENYVQKDAGKYFVELIRLMRNADANTLLELAAFPHPNKVLARKVYLDALFRTGTAESAKAIISQLNKMDEQEKKIALLSMNLVQEVDKETLKQATGLLSANSPKEVFLAVGHIVSKFCQIEGCDQGDVAAVSKKFTDALKHCKANTKKDEERIVHVLKGIRNTHHIASTADAVLIECASPGRSSRIRVAALQAFSSSRCDASLQQKALELLRDRNEDSEIRIEAYLAAIDCPTAELANQIAEIVNSETVHQVGGFISSNLKAIRDSTDSTRESQRHFLGNIRVTKQFPKDLRRYSFNNEISYKLDSLGVSASSDYKLIYSQHGFLPRSARLNASTEIFGVNFNVFEASVRQENLENILEYYLGPKGLANKNFDEIVGIIQGGEEAGGRARRSIADETNKFANKYKNYGSKNIQDLNLDLSLKLFGSEMLFLSLGDNIPSSVDDVVKHANTIFEDVKKGLSSFNKEFNIHTLFLDTEFIYPTGIGFPLELSAQGFAANKLDFGIALDVDALLNLDIQKEKYRLKFVPSVDVNVNVKLGFNAHVLSTGTRVVSSLHSATGSDVSLELLGDGFNVDIQLPREKLELIDLQLSTDLFVAELDKETKSIALKAAKKRRQEPTEDCFNQFETVGFNICFATNIPDIGKAGDDSEEIYLGQPFGFTLYMTSERRFNLKAQYLNAAETGVEKWKLSYSTPGSKVSHDTTLALEIPNNVNFPWSSVYARATLDHPQYRIALEAGYNNDNKELVLYGQYEYNNEIKKSRIGFVKNGNEYRPIIEIQEKNGVSNEISGYRVDGRVVVQDTGDKQARYTFENLQVVNKDNDRVVVNGWVDVGQVYYNSELNVALSQDSFIVKSNFGLENNDYSAGLFISNEKSPENVYGGKAHVKVGDNEVNLDLIGKAGTWEVESANAWQYEINGEDELASKLISSKFSNKLAVKNKNVVVGAAKLSGLTEGDDKFEVEAEIVRDKKVASVAVKCSQNQKTEGDYHLEVNGKLNKHFVDLLATGDVKGTNLVVNNVVTTSWGTSLTAKGELGQRYTAQDILVDLQGTAQFSGKEKPSQWTLKIIGVPEKTNSEFKLTRDNAELIKYVGELQHPQDKPTSGKMNMQIKSMVSAKADFKIAKNGKGEFNAHVEMLKSEPKHKLEVNSKFHIQAPKYDVETTVTLDADKKIYLKSENVVDKTKFSTKNVAEAGDKKASFEANGLVKGEWRLNGEIQGAFTLTGPDGRVVDGSLKRKLTTNPKTGLSQGNMDVQLSEQQPAGGAKRSLGITGKLEKANLKTKEFAVETQCVYSDFHGKKVELNYHIKHLPKGEFKTIDLEAVLKGDALETPYEVALVVDKYNSKQATYRASAKCGSNGAASVNGNYNIAERGQPASYEIQVDVQLPQTSLKTIEFKSQGKFLKPETEEGAYIAEIHIDEKAGESQFLKLKTVWKGAHRQGAYNVDLETHQMEGPLKVEGSYQQEKEVNTRDGTVSGKQKFVFSCIYAGKYVKTTSDVSYTGDEMASLRYSLDNNYDDTKNTDVLVRAQKFEIDSYQVNMQAKHGDSTYTVESRYFGSSHKKGLELHATLPLGTPFAIVGVYELLGERKAKLTLEIENLAELDFKGTLEASYNAPDDFYIVGQWRSIKLNLEDFELDVRSQGKVITFKLKNAQGVVLAGNANYDLKKEKNKAILEGQGQMEYNGKSQSSNFKLIRQYYEPAIDKEAGFSYSFNGNFGPKNAISTLKITNKDFNVKFSVCEEKKQCTNIQVQSILVLDGQEVDSIQHSLLVLIDLRELGYPHEFELQSKAIRQGLKTQYSLDTSIISNNNMKYQLVANALPSSLSLLIKLPTREILLETQQKFPPHGELFGHYENSAAFYFDKTNKPNEVTRLVASADITGVPRVTINAKGQIRFEHPSIRPLTISANLDANREQHIVDAEVVFDIFRIPEQRVVLTSRLENTDTGNGFNITTKNLARSTGLGFQYEWNGHSSLNVERQEFSAGTDISCGPDDLKASTYIYGNKDRVELLVHVLDEQIVKLLGEINRQKYTSKIESKLQIFGQKPVELSVDMHPSMTKLSVRREGLLDVNADLKLGKEAKFKVVGAGKPLYNGHISLEPAKFLQTTYESDEANVKAFLEAVENEAKTDTDAVYAQIKHRFAKMRELIDRQVQLAQDSSPDFSPLKANYESSVNEIVKELESDVSLRELIDAYRKVYTSVSKIAVDIATTSAESYEKLHKTFVALYTQLETIVRDVVLPAWEEVSVQFAKIFGELRVELVKLHTSILEAVLQILEKYGPALKNYGKVVNEALKPLYEATQELYKVIAHATGEILEDLGEYLAKLPTFDALQDGIKRKLEKMKLIENTLQFVNNLFEQANILPQTPETSEFLQKLQQYIQAKLKQQPVDDEKLIDELLSLLKKAVRSVVATLDVTAPAGAADISEADLTSLFQALPFSIDMYNKLPVLLSFRFSVINFLLSENLENILSKQFLDSWILFEDFDLSGHIADGRHVFTFDGQHITFLGSCKYILAQDSFDNNFTVIAQLNNGKMKSVILTDREGSFMEINDAGVLKINGAPQEFPQHVSGMHAWRQFYTVWMRSQYGVQIMCTSDLKVCHIDVSGFYTSKTRGLLGNGNAEPNDDLLLVDGTVTNDYAAFISGYGVGKCGPASYEEPTVVERSEVCKEIFGRNSPLALGFLLEDSAPFRAACDSAVAAAPEKDKEAAACTIALTYGSSLNMDSPLVSLPSRCLKCSGAAGQRELGSEFTTKTPNTKADLVFVVDTDTLPDVNNNLVTPVIAEVREALKSRGLTDVQVAVIAYNEHQRYPALLTSDNGKINYQGKFSEVQLHGPQTFCDDCVSKMGGDKKAVEFYELLEGLVKSVLPQSDEKAFQLALNYPFRAGAAKAIIAVRSDSLERGNLWKLTRAHITGAATDFDGAVLHVIGPVKKMSLEGVPAEKLVGFNARLVATLDGKDNKKRPKLEFHNDMGIDFVLNNGGWVFATQNFDKLQPEDQRKALNQVTNTIADSMFKTDMVNECKCVSVHGLHAQHRCAIKSSTFVPNKKPKAA